MFVIKTNYIPHGHVGLKFRNGRFVALLAPGTHMLAGMNHKVKVYKAWQGQPWIELPFDELKQLRDSDLLKNIATFVDLTDTQRALVWLDGRFHGILGPGLHGFWTTIVDVRIEIFDTRDIRFAHADADVILRHADAKRHLQVHEVDENKVAVLYQNGEFDQLLKPGRYAFWKDVGQVKLYTFDLREQVLEAEKAAQANNIKRREETAAMRSQLNSAKLIEQNPTLMRLRELESLEKFANKASLQIFVGEGQGMADRIVKLI
jgi:hypothetical protein